MTKEGLTQGEPRYRRSIHSSLMGIPPEATAHFAELNTTIRSQRAESEALHARHVRRSNQAIAATASLALERAPKDKPTSALLLGAGNCLDIPVAEIAEKFDKVTIVEFDYKSTEGAIAQLPDALQSKIEIIGADVSGEAGRLTHGILDLQRTRSFRELESKAITLFTDIAQGPSYPPDFDGTFNFVSSQLLMSQLASIPHGLLYQLLEDRYNLPQEALGKAPRLAQVLSDHGFSTHIKHLAYLRHLVGDNGAVHLADTYTRVVSDMGKETSGNLIYPNIVDPDMEKYFEALAPEKKWMWTYQRGTPVKPDVRFIVVSHALAPRPLVEPPVTRVQ